MVGVLRFRFPRPMPRPSTTRALIAWIVPSRFVRWRPIAVRLVIGRLVIGRPVTRWLIIVWLIIVWLAVGRLVAVPWRASRCVRSPVPVSHTAHLRAGDRLVA